MTLEEAIKHAEEVAEENENVVNTRTVEDGHTVDEMYCDDTECIDAHLSRCAKCAKEHRQLAEWLKDYKRLKEQEFILDKIRVEIEQAANKQFQIAMGIADLNERYTHIRVENAYRHSLNIIDKCRAESEE